MMRCLILLTAYSDMRIYRSIKKVLEEIEDKAIESRYTDMYDWQRRDLSKEDLFEYAEEMRKCLDKIFNLAIDERLK